jgi:hypothetical protein
VLETAFCPKRGSCDVTVTILDEKRARGKKLESVFMLISPGVIQGGITSKLNYFHSFFRYPQAPPLLGHPWIPTIIFITVAVHRKTVLEVLRKNL